MVWLQDSSPRGSQFLEAQAWLPQLALPRGRSSWAQGLGLPHRQVLRRARAGEAVNEVGRLWIQFQETRSARLLDGHFIYPLLSQQLCGPARLGLDNLWPQTDRLVLQALAKCLAPPSPGPRSEQETRGCFRFEQPLHPFPGHPQPPSSS